MSDSPYHIQNYQEGQKEIVESATDKNVKLLIVDALVSRFLLCLQYFSVGYYFGLLKGKKITKEAIIDFYVLLKLGVTIVLLNLLESPTQPSLCLTIIKFFIVYSLLETIHVILLKILCSSDFPVPKSYRRTSILIIINYIEVTLCFALLYLLTNSIGIAPSAESYFGKNMTNFDYIYFSFVTSVTMGSGDYVIMQTIGKKLVIAQVFIFMLFLSLFLSNNFSRLQKA